MLLDWKLFDYVRNSEVQTLLATPRAEVEHALFEWLEWWAKQPIYDPEILEFAGMGVGESGHAGLDSLLVAYIEKDPPNAFHRHELVTWFLSGYWGYSATPNARIYKAVVNSIYQLPIDSQAYLGAMFALHKLFKSKSARLPEGERDALKVLLRGQLNVLEQQKMHPGLRLYLQCLS